MAAVHILIFGEMAGCKIVAYIATHEKSSKVCNIKVCDMKLELSLNVIIPPNSSLSENRLMSQECKISDKKGLSSWKFYLIN